VRRDLLFQAKDTFLLSGFVGQTKKERGRQKRKREREREVEERNKKMQD